MKRDDSGLGLHVNPSHIIKSLVAILPGDVAVRKLVKLLGFGQDIKVSNMSFFVTRET